MSSELLYKSNRPQVSLDYRAVTKSGTGNWGLGRGTWDVGLGTWGRGDVGTWARGDARTRGGEDTGTRRRGDVGTRGRGESGIWVARTSGLGDARGLEDVGRRARVPGKSIRPIFFAAVKDIICKK